MNRIVLVQGDITQMDTDCIVNAANTSLLGGGGVDGAIHRAAGNELLEECRMLNGCKPGEAKITKGYSLKAKYIIHTVGPVWNNGKYNEEEILKNAYRNSLIVATRNNLKSISFPNISTGIYRFPKQKAAEIAIMQVNEYLIGNPIPEKVVFVCFDTENYNIYNELLNNGSCS